MKLNLYEKSNKSCNLERKLFCVLKLNILVLLKSVDGMDEDLTFRLDHAQLNISLIF